MNPAALSGYARLEGAIPLLYAPRTRERAERASLLLETGAGALSEALVIAPPELEALLVAEEDWRHAPRGNSRPYPPGLPYFTRSVRPPALVLPERLSPTFQPRTECTCPLAIWHELGHAFLLEREVVRTPVWLRELVPQTSAAAVARRAGLPLDEHVGRTDRDPGFTARSPRGPAVGEVQMKLQNLLLALGAAALDEFGEGALRRLVRALRNEATPISEGRAEGLLAEALGDGGGAWLDSRPEF